MAVLFPLGVQIAEQLLTADTPKRALGCPKGGKDDPRVVASPLILRGRRVSRGRQLGGDGFVDQRSLALSDLIGVHGGLLEQTR